MGFIVGLLGGIVAGAAGAVWYSQQTGRDLRDEFRQVRSEIQARDFDGLANHLEDRFKELQTSIDRMRAEADERSGSPSQAGPESQAPTGGFGSTSGTDTGVPMTDGGMESPISDDPTRP